MDINKLIIDNEKLIYSIMKYFKNYNSKEDLYQAGCLGIIKAYKNYKPSFECKFTTYAYTYIVGEMKKLVRSDKSIKISREISKLNLKIEKAYILLSQKLMREPNALELSKFLDIPTYYIEEAINSSNRIMSIDEAITSDSKELTLQDIIGKYNNIDELLILKEQLNNLNKEEYSIISNRYINDYTQTETSNLMGISQVQVSRKEKKVLEKLKKELV